MKNTAIQLQPKAEFIGVSHRFKSKGVQRTIVLKAEPNYEDYELYNQFAAVGGTVYFKNGKDFAAQRPTVAIFRAELSANETKGKDTKPLSDEEQKVANREFITRFAKMSRSEFGLKARVTKTDIKKLCKILGVSITIARNELYELTLKFV